MIERWYNIYHNPECHGPHIDIEAPGLNLSKKNDVTAEEVTSSDVRQSMDKTIEN